jgi:hypothetical protein
MSFQKLADEFNELVERYSGTKRDHRDLVSEIRDCCARAGRLLFIAIKNKSIPHPKHPPNWFRFIFNKKLRTRFKAFEIFRGTSGRTEPPMSFHNLLYTFASSQGTFDVTASPRLLEEDADCFKYRHLFIEAVVDWLPQQYPNMLLHKISMERWSVETVPGKKIEFISDWIHLDNKGKVDNAISLVKACRDTCLLLENKVVSKDKSNVERDTNKSKKPNTSKATSLASDSKTHHPLENMVQIDSRSSRMAHRGLRALLDADQYELTGSQLQELKISKAQDDGDAALAVYQSIQKAFSETQPYLKYRKGNPSKKIEPMVWLKTD